MGLHFHMQLFDSHVAMATLESCNKCVISHIYMKRNCRTYNCVTKQARLSAHFQHHVIVLTGGVFGGMRATGQVGQPGGQVLEVLSTLRLPSVAIAAVTLVWSKPLLG